MLKNMNARLDAIIFGATGFTGKFVVQHATEIYENVTWGIAGRNKEKLQSLLADVGKTVNKDLSNIPIIVADIADEASLKEMASKCRVVLNCCGPYYLYGEVVVKACVESGAHYVDVTGEPQFMGKMRLKYNEMAKEKHVYIVSACGFESIPAELGFIYVEKQFSGTLNSVEMFLETGKSNSAMLNKGTWESLIHALGHPFDYLSTLRKMNRMEGTDVPRMSPKLFLKPYIQRPDFLSSYFIPFPATDSVVVKHSQRLRYYFEGKTPVEFEVYLGLRSFGIALVVPLFMMFYFLMSLCSCTRNLLIKYPKTFTMGVMSDEGPGADAAPILFTFKAKGWSGERNDSTKPDKKLLARATACNVYDATSVSLLYCAKTILNESDKMPESGGVLPPGAAFANTSLVEELPKHRFGVKLEILE